MSELFGALKLLAFTLLLVMFMQMKVGGRTLEARAQLWIHTSNIGQTLNEVAAGGKKLFIDAQEKLADFCQKNFGGRK